MKQLSLNDVIAAFSDTPNSIGNRLVILGVSKAEARKKFSDDILKAEVYASSFVKFLQDNANILINTIPAEQLPENYKNPFDSNNSSVGDRLNALRIDNKDINEMFNKQTLDLSLTGDEFQDFIVKNQDKFLNKLQNLATKGD